MGLLIIGKSPMGTTNKFLSTSNVSSKIIKNRVMHSCNYKMKKEEEEEIWIRGRRSK